MSSRRQARSEAFTRAERAGTAHGAEPSCRLGKWMVVYAGLVSGVLGVVGCNRRDVPKMRDEPVPSGAHAVEIHQPARLERVRLGAPPAAVSRASDGDDEQGDRGGTGQPGRARLDGEKRTAAVRCATCHALRKSATLPASMLELDQFHQGLELRHGRLGCASCHSPGDTPTLHLADGRALAPGRAIELCQQCHGPQYRDYEHGAHGGMTGYWDLSRGPRTRNHCVDCHDPHAPQIRQVLPVDPPRDRFFGERASGSIATHAGDQH